MDDTTATLLARFQRQMAKADRLYDRAELIRTMADRHPRDAGHYADTGATMDSLPARQLRQDAEALERRAAEVQRNLFREPPAGLSRQIDDWIAGRNPGGPGDGHER